MRSLGEVMVDRVVIETKTSRLLCVCEVCGRRYGRRP